MRLPLVSVLCTLLLAAPSGGCGKPPVEPRYAPGVAPGASITVTSRSFTEGTRIPVDHTCDGTDVMPELVLSSPPENTKSIVVYLEDPDASGGSFTHMVAFDLAPEMRKLPSAPDLTAAGDAARFGVNDTVLKLPEGSPRSKVDAGMDGHILGEGSLMGHFGH
jgi:phosphatidylethanolamine-binding protein (PEBP) family uncharacterized protein